MIKNRHHSNKAIVYKALFVLFFKSCRYVVTTVVPYTFTLSPSPIHPFRPISTGCLISGCWSTGNVLTIDHNSWKPSRNQPLLLPGVAHASHWCRRHRPSDRPWYDQWQDQWWPNGQWWGSTKHGFQRQTISSDSNWAAKKKNMLLSIILVWLVNS